MMAENSKIEWTDHTFNPWMGCAKVSDGCKHCYAENLMDKRYGKVKWGPQGRRVRTSAANWRKPIQWNKKRWWRCLWCGWRGDDSALAAPDPEMLLEPKTPCPSCNHWQLEPTRARVFCASLADVFEDKPDQPEMMKWRNDLFNLIDETPNLDWLLLTKRPENVMKMIPSMWEHHFGSFPDNLWIGTSVENQEQADKRINELVKIPAAVRFLSMEPLLGPVDFSQISIIVQYKGSDGEWDYTRSGKKSHIDWVIVGGESGPNARPMHPDWARSLRDQCGAADVPFFFKQWGEWAPDCLCGKPNPCKTIERPSGKRGVMFKCGKHAAGRQLDGVEWSQFPEVVQHG